MKIFKLLVGLWCAFSIFATHADYDCADYSWHLQKEIDNKEFHLVQCNCPCNKRYFLNIRNGLQCEKCMHYRDPKPLIIVGRTDKIRFNKNYDTNNSKCRR